MHESGPRKRGASDHRFTPDGQFGKVLGLNIDRKVHVTTRAMNTSRQPHTWNFGLVKERSRKGESESKKFLLLSCPC